MEPSNTSNISLNDLAVLVTIVGSAVGILAVFGRGIASWLKGKWDKRMGVANIDVEKAKVRVTEREAQTHEIAVILEGYAVLTAASAARAESAEKSVAHAHERLNKTEERLSKVEDIKDEMIEHIKILEKMVPNPPGPPTRPNWHVE